MPLYTRDIILDLVVHLSGSANQTINVLSQVKSCAIKRLLPEQLTLHLYTQATILDILGHVHPSDEHAAFQNVPRIPFVSHVQYLQTLGHEIRQPLALLRAMPIHPSGLS